MRWRIAFEFDTPNDYYAAKVGDDLREFLSGFAVENVEMAQDEEVEPIEEKSSH